MRGGLLSRRRETGGFLSIEGSGEIVAVDNGGPTAHTPFQAMRRAIFNGPVLVIVRAGPGAGCSILIRAAAEGLDPVSITINNSKP